MLEWYDNTLSEPTSICDLPPSRLAQLDSVSYDSTSSHESKISRIIHPAAEPKLAVHYAVNVGLAEQHTLV